MCPFSTRRRYFPRDSYFSKDVLSRRLRELAFLNPGVSITLTDERDDWTATYCYEGGIRSYVEFSINRERLFIQTPFTFQVANKA